MITANTKSKIIKRLEHLKEDEQKKVLDFIENFEKKPVRKIDYSKFAGSISNEDLLLMEKAINEYCENIDKDEW